MASNLKIKRKVCVVSLNRGIDTLQSLFDEGYGIDQEATQRISDTIIYILWKEEGSFRSIPSVNYQKALELLLQEMYFQEFEIIDGLNQHRDGLNYYEWLHKKQLIDNKQSREIKEQLKKEEDEEDNEGRTFVHEYELGEQEWEEDPEEKTGWSGGGWFFKDSDVPINEDEYELYTVTDKDKFYNPIEALFKRK